MNARIRNEYLGLLVNWAMANNIPAKILPRDKESLMKLKNLDLSNLGITSLPTYLIMLPSLIRLNVSNNPISNFHTADISWKFDNLKYLYISGTLIKDFTGILEAAPKLRILDISNSLISSIPLAVNTLLNLRGLKCTHCNITAISALIIKHSKLRYLDISYTGVTAIPNSLYTLHKLENLIINGLQLTDIDNAISRLTKLKYLSCQDNHLTELPLEIFTLVHLHTINVANNKLEKLGHSIGSLANLQHLNLSDNRLHGLPTSVQILPKLKIMRTARNCVPLPEMI